MKNFDSDTECENSLDKLSSSQLCTLILTTIVSGEQQQWTSATHLFVRLSRQLLNEDFLDDFLGEHSLLRFVQIFQTSEKIYWRDREGKCEIAGIGVAHSIQGGAENLSSVIRRVHDATLHAPQNVRYFGGTRFHATSTPDEVWQHCPETAFVLPFIELERIQDNVITLHCTVSVPYYTSPETARELMLERFQAFQAEQSNAISESFFTPPSVVKRTNTPDKKAWSASIHAALRDFEAGTLEKVVLARRVRLECAEPPDAAALLQERLQTAERATAMLLQFDHTTQFFVATPELLYKREGRLISTEAVAGTRKRGVNTSDEAAIAEEFLNSDKERREHASVQRYIASALDELTESFSIGTVELLKLSTMQHLYAPFSGRLRANIDDATILEQLHPTPAVGGTPRREAASFLLKTETFDRGWYAAPVGWVNAHAAEFVVAIRSALVQGASVYAFSGAGIVAGSEAEAEWREIELKIAPLLKLFQVNEEKN